MVFNRREYVRFSFPLYYNSEWGRGSCKRLSYANCRFATVDNGSSDARTRIIDIDSAGKMLLQSLKRNGSDG
jgi:hypothetical protein